MPRHRSLRVAGLALVFSIGLVSARPVLRAAGDTLPDRLSDADFWTLSQALSEPNGYFRSDNLLSNEIWFQYTLADLTKRTGPGGVYLGVGPEQNFTYIAALRPKMVFITDIRRGNLHTQLMYKALFDLSKDRAEFVSRLFTKKRPDTLTATSTATEIFNAYWDIPTSAEPVYKENLKAIQDDLTKAHHLPLDKEDLDGIEYVYYNFYWFGPSITYNSSSGAGRGRGSMANYYDLMTANDGAGTDRSYLANEENFRILKDLESKNLIVPVVGNFGGPTALRAVGQYIRDHGATVTAFYLSNVEQYLYQDGLWGRFCANVATMPLDEHSTFIRSSQGGGYSRGGGLMNSLGSMQAETRACGASQTGGSDVRMLK
jgi:hypothetical protein